jgi:hypothetical protein
MNGAPLVVAEMVTFLITFFFILAILAVAFYFWQKPASATDVHALMPPPPGRGLFIESEFDSQPPAEADSEALANAARQRSELLARAQAGDKTALQDTLADKDPALYQEALNLLIARVDSGPELLSLVSFVSRHELPVNKNLAEKFIDSCQLEPDRISTVKMLHVAALSDEAATYQRAVEMGLEFWRKRLLGEMSGQELRSILEGEFWILSSRTRSSGAGFILKRTLASARRELQPAQNE